MPLTWMDVTSLSFNSLLLLERVQLSWFPGWLPEADLAIALQANPVVEWFMRHKCPDLNEWLDKVMLLTPSGSIPASEVRMAEIKVLNTIQDLLVYVIDPSVYDAQPFNQWDSAELTALVDFNGKTVIDVGAGTGRLALVATEKARTVYAVEPVANLRRFLKQKAHQRGFHNIYCLDGLVTDIPFPDEFADVTMGGHVYGDLPEQEIQEMLRVTKKGGMVILMGGGGPEGRQFLLSRGFHTALYEEPETGTLGKFWLVR